VEGRVDDPLLAITEFDGDSLIVVVGPKHRWGGRNKISPKDLVTTAWVLRERGSGTRSMFESALRKFGIKLSDLRVALELPSNEAVRTAIETGDCATAISDLVVAQSLAAKTLHHVKIDLPRRPFYVLRHKERHPSRIEQALLEALHI
jgi:DNA-binding transcriptional LysR family regulator